MNRIGTFFVGFLLGGLTCYGALHFHIVRANDSVHFIPKLTSTLTETYVDVREFGFDDWRERSSLAAAITAAGKTEIMQGTVTRPFGQMLDGYMGGASNP